MMQYTDDSAINLTAGEAFGWTCVHLVEPELPEPENRACNYRIRSLEELRNLFPRLFKSTTNGA